MMSKLAIPREQNALRNRPDEEEEAMFGEIVAATHLLGPNLRNNIEVKKQARDISELKEQLEQKDREIEELRKKVKSLAENNYDLLIKLEAKDEEVKSLKVRIQNLEDEKRDLQRELASVQHQLKAIEDDVKKLTKSKESNEENSHKLYGELKKIQFTLKEVKDDLAATKTENEKLKKQVRHQSRYVPGAPPLLSVKASEDSKATSHLGEMCCQIQDAMYKKVLPQHFTPLRSYKMQDIKKDIEKLPKDVEHQQQATKLWEDLKTKLKWNENIEEALEALQGTYRRSVDSNPPNLNEKFLRECVSVLERFLKGWLSTDRVNSLIDIWKTLVHCGQN